MGECRGRSKGSPRIAHNAGLYSLQVGEPMSKCWYKAWGLGVTLSVKASITTGF